MGLNRWAVVFLVFLLFDRNRHGCDSWGCDVSFLLQLLHCLALFSFKIGLDVSGRCGRRFCRGGGWAASILTLSLVPPTSVLL